MTRSKLGGKGPGAELWSRRPISNKHGCSPGKTNKKRTHHAERQGARIKITDGELEARDREETSDNESPRSPRAAG